MVPVADLLLLEFLVFDGSQIQHSSVGKQETTVSQPLVTGEEDRVQHALVEQKVPHPLGYDYVNLVHRQRDFFHLALDVRDDITKTVGVPHRFRSPDNLRALHPDHLRSPGLRREEAQDPRARAHVQHGLAFKQMGVVHDRPHVVPGPHGVLEHVLVDAEVGIGVEVVVGGGGLRVGDLIPLGSKLSQLLRVSPGRRHGRADLLAAAVPLPPP
mmetsp:Transcript_61804/g.165541  ORF Transcript_61804/g.165541 Transcript_61804/m.165541 type:complete len:213 (-) Transcript_61804:44-682(-)